MRHAQSAAYVTVTFLTCFSLLPAEPANPDFSGIWESDAAKSQLQDGTQITLKIEKVENKIKWNRSVRDKDGKQATAEFLCEAGGGECVLDEGSHKSKVTLWFNGPSLVVLKTEGDKEDASTEWTLSMSADKKILTMALEHIEPTGNPETVVLNKK